MGARTRQPARWRRARPSPHGPGALLPDMPPSFQAPLRLQAGPQVGAWPASSRCHPNRAGHHAPTARYADRLIEASPATTSAFAQQHLPAGRSMTAEGAVDRFGDHALACPRTGLLARRAKIVERVWVRVAGKRWSRKGKSFRSSGWPTSPPSMSERRTVAGSTSSCTGR